MHMIELVSGANHCIRQRHERKANWTPNYPSVDEVEWFICIFRLEMLMTRIIYAFSLSCGGLDCVWKKEFHDHFYAARQNRESGERSVFHEKIVNKLIGILYDTCLADLVESCAAQRRRIMRKIHDRARVFPRRQRKFFSRSSKHEENVKIKNNSIWCCFSFPSLSRFNKRFLWTHSFLLF